MGGSALVESHREVVTMEVETIVQGIIISTFGALLALGWFGILERMSR